MMETNTLMSLARRTSEFVTANEILIGVVAIFILFANTFYRKSDASEVVQPRRFWLDEAVYLVLMAVSVTLLRAPTWLMGETNLDEAQWIAGTITLDHQFAFWGRVDTMTSGPLNVHFLWLWSLVAGEHTFQMAKVLTTILAVLNVSLAYATLRQFTHRQQARWLVASFALALGLMRMNDYVGYNGEQLPIVLLAACLLFIARAHTGKPTWHLEWAFTGALLGALPYTKLQAIPMGVLLGCIILWRFWRDRRIITLVLGVIAVHALIWLVLWHTGQAQDFWIRCVEQSLDYSQNYSSIPLVKRFYVFPIAWMRISEARAFVIACSVAIVMSFFVRMWRVKSLGRCVNAAMFVTFAYAVVSAYSVTQPGNYFTHYYLFMLYPMFMCAATFAWGASETEATGTTPQKARYFAIVCASMILAALIPGVIAARSPSVLAAMKSTLTGELPVAQRIRELASEETALAVWGWNPRLYVDTQLPQATSEALSYHQIVPKRLQSYYLDRYAAELSASDDLIFVDITGPGGSYMFTGPEHDHSHYEVIAKFVNEQLEYIDTVNGARIYRSPRHNRTQQNDQSEPQQ